jgi:hypothetical protein
VKHANLPKRENSRRAHVMGQNSKHNTLPKREKNHKLHGEKLGSALQIKESAYER